MERSPEIRERTLAIYDVLVGHAPSGEWVLMEPGVHGIGSDPDEWWIGGDELESILIAQGESLKGASILDADPQAYCEGDVGWVYDRFRYRTPEGVETPFRITASFVRRDGQWRLALWHDSVPMPNSEAIGVQIPT